MDKLFGIILALFIAACAAKNAFTDMTDEAFKTECNFNSTNYRKNHSAAAFVVTKELTDWAKFRCNNISQYDGLSAGHAGNDKSGYGENLYYAATSANYTYPCSEAIFSWYNESSQYDYSKPGFQYKAGHFTQLVWKATTEVGCARCFGKGAEWAPGKNWYETYIVCNYKGPGNVNTEQYFKDNVFPLIKP